MVAHQTDTRTLITEGLLSHNTWWEFQDQADREGGCWNPTANMRVAFRLLRGKMGALGLRAALASYNGTGQAAQRYADSVLALRDKWAERL